MCRYLIHAAGPAGACQRVAGPRDAPGAANPEPPSAVFRPLPCQRKGPTASQGSGIPALFPWECDLPRSPGHNRRFPVFRDMGSPSPAWC